MIILMIIMYMYTITSYTSITYSGSCQAVPTEGGVIEYVGVV